jgi:hypothetical protein
VEWRTPGCELGPELFGFQLLLFPLRFLLFQSRHVLLEVGTELLNAVVFFVV